MTGAAPTLRVKHVGGAEAEVTVTEATDDGVLHVRFPGATGSGSYALHVFKLAPKPAEPVEGRGEPAGSVRTRLEGTCWVWKTTRARHPLPWRAADVGAAQALWRQMTGRDKAKEWEAVWVDGRREWRAK